MTRAGPLVGAGLPPGQLGAHEGGIVPVPPPLELPLPLPPLPPAPLPPSMVPAGQVVHAPLLDTAPPQPAYATIAARQNAIDNEPRTVLRLTCIRQLKAGAVPRPTG